MSAVLLCDLDGVLVDSGHAIARVYRAWAAERGLDADLVVSTAQGRPSRAVVRVCAPSLDACAESVRIDAAHAADQDGVVAVRGAAELLASVPPDRIAVVTSCSEDLAAARLAAAGLPRPRVVVTADDVVRGKPDPEGYLRAAAALGAEPAACVVLEDAPAGVAAGRAAGMSVIALTTSHDAAQLGAAHAIVADLVGVRALAERLLGRSP